MNRSTEKFGRRREAAEEGVESSRAREVESFVIRAFSLGNDKYFIA